MTHLDPDIALQGCGIYSHGNGKSPWHDVEPDELRQILAGGSPPVFRTALTKLGEDTFAGPFYVDIDSGDVEEAIDSLRALLAELEGLGLDLEAVRLFATGGKGFHLEIPDACYMVEPGAVDGLPRIFKEMALAVYVDCLDLRVYSGGRGRLWRVPNIRRDNGAHKVPLSLAEGRALTVASYAELCSAPRPFPPLAAPSFCPGLGALFEKARAKVAGKAARTKAATCSAAVTELRRRWNGAAPPSLRPLLQGEAQSSQGFNIVALQLGLLAHALGWDEGRLIDECAGLIANHDSDGRRYNTPAKREREVRRMFDYTWDSDAYSFSVAGLRSILPPGTRSPDLQGLEADAPEDAPDYAELIDAAAGNAGAVVAVARQIQRDEALSVTETAALLKRCARAADVGIKALRADLWQPADAEGLTIEVKRHDFAGSVDRAMAVLPHVPSLRVRGSVLVEVAGGLIRPVQLPRLAYLTCTVAAWKYPDGVGAPDPMVLQGVMAAGSWPVPELIGIARQPTILGDGTIGTPEGFEPVYRPEDFPACQGSGAEALAELRNLLQEFPFASGRDEAAALAAILTAAARPTLRTAPAFMITAHDLGSGKSYLAELIGLFAAEDVPMLRWAQRAEEQDKSILSLLMEGRSVCVFDNLLKNWASPTMAAVLTAPTYADRVLGASEAINVSTRCLWLATGNNVKPAADLSRRVITVELDPRCENPLTREFNGDPLGEVRAHRGRWVMCALRVLQDFAASGVQPKLTPLASFGEWSALIRGALAWYGLPDVIGGVVAQVEEDDDRALLGFVLETWAELFADEPVTLRAVLRDLEALRGPGVTALRGLFLEVAGERNEINARKLGCWLREQSGRVVRGRRIVPYGGKSRDGQAWQIVAA